MYKNKYLKYKKKYVELKQLAGSMDEQKVSESVNEQKVYLIARLVKYKDQDKYIKDDNLLLKIINDRHIMYVVNLNKDEDEENKINTDLETAEIEIIYYLDNNQKIVINKKWEKGESRYLNLKEVTLYPQVTHNIVEYSEDEIINDAIFYCEPKVEYLKKKSNEEIGIFNFIKEESNEEIGIFNFINEEKENKYLKKVDGIGGNVFDLSSYNFKWSNFETNIEFIKRIKPTKPVK